MINIRKLLEWITNESLASGEQDLRMALLDDHLILRDRKEVEKLLAHYRSGECREHNPACTEEVVTILEWILTKQPESSK